MRMRDASSFFWREDMSSSISGPASNTIYENRGATASSAGKSGVSADSRSLGSETDSVEISAEARAKQQADQNSRSLMNPAKPIRKGSAEYDQFEKLLNKVKNQKSDLNSRIQDVIKKTGVNIKGLGSLKLEVDKGGRVVAGGLSDEKAARAIEKALNADPSLAREIQDYQKNEKTLSGKMKEYTGCSLYELTMTARGDINDRIRSEIEQGGKYQMDSDYYMRLGFLGKGAGQIVDTDDIMALSFDGGIDFSGEISVMSDPKGEIEKTVNEMLDSINSSLDALNEELTKALGDRTAKGGKAKEGALLSLEGVTISVDSDGGVKIEGRLSEDDEIHRKGVAVVEKAVRDMLAEAGNNSYRVNVFMAASQNMLKRDGGGSGSRIVAEIAGGRIGDIRPESAASRAAAQKDNAKEALTRSMASVLGAY